MGKFTVERWSCDRCGAIHDKQPPHRGFRHSVMAIVDYPDDCAGGAVFTWKDLCPDCDAEVSRELNAMRVSADKARAAREGSRP